MVYHHSSVTNLPFLLHKPYKLLCQVLNTKTNIYYCYYTNKIMSGIKWVRHL